MRCLVTGFDAFGKLSKNPSQAIVEELAKLDLGEELDTLTMKTCCQEGWGALKKKLAGKSKAPEVLVMLGLAEGRKTISLERFALNIRDYRIPDNKKHQPLDEVIDKKAPDAIKSALPLAQMAKHLTKSGYPTEVSNHAGAFVCNDLYFNALNFRRVNGYPKVALFVHIPLPKIYAETISETKKSAKSKKKKKSKDGLEQLCSAVVEIIKVSCAQSAGKKR